MKAQPMAFLVDWFARQCDDDWEHDLGITIETLDNPGWKVAIRIGDTELEGKVVDLVKWEEDDLRWLHWRSTGDMFEAACGPRELDRALRAFEEFASSPMKSVDERGSSATRPPA